MTYSLSIAVYEKTLTVLIQCIEQQKILFIKPDPNQTTEDVLDLASTWQAQHAFEQLYFKAVPTHANHPLLFFENINQYLIIDQDIYAYHPIHHQFSKAPHLSLDQFSFHSWSTNRFNDLEL